MNNKPMCFYLTKDRKLAAYGGSEEMAEFEAGGEENLESIEQITAYILRELLEAEYSYAEFKEVGEGVEGEAVAEEEDHQSVGDRELGRDRDEVIGKTQKEILAMNKGSQAVTLKVGHRPSSLTYKNYFEHGKDRVELCAYVFDSSVEPPVVKKIIRLKTPPDYKNFRSQLDSIASQETNEKSFVQFQTYRSYENPVIPRRKK